MKLHEYQAKEVFGKYNIPVQKQIVVDTAAEAEKAAEEIGGTVVVKAQVLSGGRGKAGGVKLAKTPQEARAAGESILKITVQGMPVKKLLVVSACDIDKEYYLAITVDRSRKQPLLIFSAEGGMDIEQLAQERPEALLYIEIDSLHGLTAENLEKIESSVGAAGGGKLQRDMQYIVRQLYRLFLESDCSMVEINPLAQLTDGSLIALDAKMVVDDNALHKHADLAGLRNDEEYHPDELTAIAQGLSFVSLDGDIGCIVNGAGLAMATMDLIKHFGGDPANFLDVGGSSNPEKMLNALRILDNNSKLRGILINIFGGITRCDDIAKGLLLATAEIEIKIPIVVRLVGTNETEGRRILEEAGYTVYNQLNEAVEKVVAV